MGLSSISRDARLCSYDFARRSVLLLFRRGGVLKGATAAGRKDTPLHNEFPSEAVVHRILCTWELFTRQVGFRFSDKFERDVGYG